MQTPGSRPSEPWVLSCGGLTDSGLLTPACGLLQADMRPLYHTKHGFQCPELLWLTCCTPVSLACCDAVGPAIVVLAAVLGCHVWQVLVISRPDGLTAGAICPQRFSGLLDYQVLTVTSLHIELLM